MTNGGEPPPDDEESDARIPEYFRGHESVWESVQLARFGGASRAEVSELASAAYAGYVDPSVDSATRNAARNEAQAGFSYFGVGFDWAQWRREMGY